MNDYDDYDECVCGTIYRHFHAYYEGFTACPTCALAKKLGYEIKHTRNGRYEADKLEWIKETE